MSRRLDVIERICGVKKIGRGEGEGAGEEARPCRHRKAGNRITGVTKRGERGDKKIGFDDIQIFINR